MDLTEKKTKYSGGFLSQDLELETLLLEEKKLCTWRV